METSHVGRVLEDLLETLEDGKKGFTQTAEKLTEANRDDLAGRMREFADQRSSFGAEIRTLASQLGIELDESGSMAGALHRGWISLKDALASDEPAAVLAAAETGEDHAKDEFTKALDEDLPGDVRTLIARQAAAVAAVHDEVKKLRDEEKSA
ncbi:MAG TPA: PA2169 family four-helix-bundle protein [Acidimicrobiia bacterium]|nr:PA2169 family four-helix-bundle protein [Acidimicrobiia bacterium]